MSFYDYKVKARKGEDFDLAALKGKVDAIIVTGGIAHDEVLVRKLAEYAVYTGVGLMLPIIMVSFMVRNVRITFLILTLIVAVLAFIYPLSSFSKQIDERDISLKPQKKQRGKQAAKAPAFGDPSMAQVSPDGQLPSGAVVTDPQVDAAIPEQQYDPAFGQQDPYQVPVQQYVQPEPQVPSGQQYRQNAQPQYRQPARQKVQQQYQQPAQQQYQQNVQQQYQTAPDQNMAQQYNAPTGDPYASGQYGSPEGASYAQQPVDPYAGSNQADPYAGSNPASFETQPQQAPADPLAFLNSDENEGGNQNG